MYLSIYLERLGRASVWLVGGLENFFSWYGGKVATHPLKVGRTASDLGEGRIEGGQHYRSKLKL